MAAFLENTRIWENITSYLVYFLFVAYFLGIFVLTTKDQTALDNNKNIMYLFSIIIPLVAFTYMIFSNVGETQMFMFLACITIFLSIFLFRSAIPSSDKIINDSMLYFTGFSNLPMVSDQTSFLVSWSLNLLFIIITISAYYNHLCFKSKFQKENTTTSPDTYSRPPYALFCIMMMILLWLLDQNTAN